MVERHTSDNRTVFAAVVLGIAAPTVYAIHVMAASWTGIHTAIVLAIVGACAWRTAEVAGLAIGHAFYNRQQRDAARTHAMVDGVARPAFTDGREQLALTQGMAAASTALGRAAGVWERLDSGALAVPTAVEDDGPRISVWGQPLNEGGRDGR